MANQALITRVFKAMTPITYSIESGINTMDKHLQTLSPAQKKLYLTSILSKTMELNEAILSMAKRLKPRSSKRKSTMKGGMHRGQLIARPQQLGHRHQQHMARHGPNAGRNRHTRRERRGHKFNQWAAKPLFVLGGGIALGLIIYKLILPLVFKKTPGAVARVSGKLAEAVAVKLADGISWTSAATTATIQPLVSFFDFSVKEVQFYQPTLRDGRGNPYPEYPAVTGPVQGWPVGENYEPYAPPSSGWFSRISDVTLDPSSQLSRVNPSPFVQANVHPPAVVRYLSNSVRNMNLSKTLGSAVESLLESAVDDETRNIFFILSLLGGITITIGVLLLLDRHRATMAVQVLNMEQREAELENGPHLNQTRELQLNQARLEGQLAALQQLLGARGNPALPVLQGLEVGAQLANPGQLPALLANAPVAQGQQILEELNEE